jgi:hypothetical protein
MHVPVDRDGEHAKMALVAEESWQVIMAEPERFACLPMKKNHSPT